MRTVSGVWVALVLAILMRVWSTSLRRANEGSWLAELWERCRAARDFRRRSRSIATTSAQLKVAWTFRTGALDEKRDLNEKATFETTPILVDGKLYLSTPWGQVFALDPATGTKIWEFDPDLDLTHSYSEATQSRSFGVARFESEARLRMRAANFYRDDQRASDCARWTDGKAVRGLWHEGQVDLTRDVELRDVGDYQVTSAPAIAGDVVITGSSIGDNRAVRLERGIVRAIRCADGSTALELGSDSVGEGYKAANRRGKCVVDAFGGCGA